MPSKIGIALTGIETTQFDVDALTFLSTAGITDGKQKIAINNLVRNLKLKSLWQKFDAIYPIVGGTSTTHSYNLRNTSQYNLTFNGGWTHSSTGATPNGTNAFASTGYTYANATTNDTHLSYYSRTSSAPNVSQSRYPVEIGNGSTTSPTVIEYALLVSADIAPNTLLYSRQYSDPGQPGQINGQVTVANTDSTGFYVGSRTSSTSHKAYKNGVQVGATNTTTNTYTLAGAIEIQLAKGPGGSYSNRQCAFATIGKGLTDAEVETLSSIVANYQIELDRILPAIAVGNSVIQYSSDAINWTTAGAAAVDYRAVGWSPEIYTWVAVGVSSTIAVSSNGQSWATTTCSNANTWDRVIWASGMNLFVATAAVSSAASNAVMTSPNGINWTNRTATSTNNWRELAYSPSLNRLVSVCSNGTSTTAVQTSDDGITWTTRTAPSGGAWWGVAWSPNLSLFCAVKFGSTNVMTSPDGITWTARTGGNANQWIGVAWSPNLGLFAAVANSGTQNRVQTSPDGINWTVRTTPVAADIGWNAISWSDRLQLFVAVAAAGPSSQQIMTSKDGITWTMRNSTTNTLIGVGTI